MWEVIGYEVSSNSEGAITGYTIYCTKPFKGEEGHGQKAKRFWYRPSINYSPNVGDRVFVEVEMRTFGQKSVEVVTDIVVC